MSFDIKTIFALLFLADLAIVGFLFLYRILININRQRFNLYILGKLLQAVSILFHALIRDQVSYPIAILAGNIPGIFGIALETYSFTVFSTAIIKNKINLYIAIAGIMSVVFAANLYSALHIRVIVVFFTYTLFFILTSIVLLYTKQKSKLKLSTSVLFLVIALLTSYRMLDAFFTGVQIQLFNQQFSEMAAFLVFFLVSFVLTLNFVFLFKEADEETINSNKKMLADILNAFPDQVFVINSEKQILYSNFNKINGETISEKPMYCDDLLFGRKYCSDCKIEQLNSKNTQIRNEYFNEKTGKYYDTTHIYLQNKNYLTIRKDVTQDKKVERKVKMLSDIVEQSPASIVVTNLNGELEYVNKAFCENTGYTYNEAIGQNPRILQSDLVNKENYVDLWEKLTHGQIWQGEFINKTKSGEIYYEDALIAPTFDQEGNIVNYFGIKYNITDKKLAENALRQSEENLKKAQALAKIGHWSLDILNNKLEWSDEVYRIFEVNKETFEPTYKDFIDFIHPDDKDAVDKAFKESINQKTKYEMVHRIKLHNGKIKYVQEQCDTIYTSKGIPCSSIGTVQDITEKEEADQIIKENEQALDKYFEFNPIPIAVIDLQTAKYIKVNMAYAEIFGRTNEEIIGKTPFELKITTEERLKQLEEIIITHGRLEGQRGTITDKNGNVYDVITNAELIELRGKKLLYTTSVNVTELNKAKQQLENSNIKLTQALEDKNILLKEVHHRVKNNLQTISSLLFKQQRNSADEMVKLVLQDSIDRISSIALINEQIYRSENFKEIDLSKHIHEICQHLLVAYQQPDKTISLVENLEKVMLNIEKAIPFSLVVNELVSNSLKHGFKNKTLGKITIDLNNMEDNTVLLTVTDDGVGLPEGFQYESSKSLGMFIIFNLSKRQLLGNVELISDNGTRFSLKFKK